MKNANSLKNLRPYPKGVSGFAGRAHCFLPEELRGIKALTNAEVCRLISKYARMDHDKLIACLEERKIPVLELAFCSIFNKSIETGDFTRIAFLLDRAIGKAPVAIDDNESQDAREELSRLSMKELLTLVKNNLPEDDNEEPVL